MNDLTSEIDIFNMDNLSINILIGIKNLSDVAAKNIIQSNIEEFNRNTYDMMLAARYTYYEGLSDLISSIVFDTCYDLEEKKLNKKTIAENFKTSINENLKTFMN